MLFHEMLASGFALYPSDPADPRFNEFLLEHSWRWLRGETGRGFFDLPMAWPVQNLLAHSEPMLSFGPFYWPFRALGLSSSTSHQLWMMLMAALNFGAFYALVRRALCFDPLAASASAFLFAFGLPRVAQIGHSQLWPQLYIVAVLFGLHALLSESPSDRARRWAAPAVIVGLSLQAWGCLYNAIFLAYACLVTGLFALSYSTWRTRALRTLRETPPIGYVCIAVAIACLWPLAESYAAAAGSTSEWNATEARLLQPRIGSLVYVWRGSWFYGWMTTATPLGQLPAVHEQALGLGFLTTGVVLYTLASHWRTPAVRLIALLVLVLFLPAMMWPGDQTAWWSLHGRLPGLGSLRSISRMGLLLLIPASVALGACIQRRSETRWPGVWIAIVMLCLLEQGTKTFHFAKEPFERGVARLVESIDPQSEAFLYVGAGLVPAWFTDVDAILAAQRAGVPAINMYSGRSPKGYRLYRNVATNPEMLQRIERDLDQWIQLNGLDPNRVQLIEQEEIWGLRADTRESQTQ
jgi:hypothetical protein